MKTIITIANHKGGTGKTTTAINLGVGLEQLGYPIVLVDCDPQHNITDFLGMEPAPSLYEIIAYKAKATDHIHRYKESNLVVIPSEATSTFDLESLFRTPAARLDTATALRDALAPFGANGTSKPTVIIIDTAPSLSHIQITALAAADWLLIPAKAEFASETGISTLVQDVANLQAGGGKIELLGILPTMVDLRTVEHRETIEALKKAFPGLILPPIRNRISIAEAPGRGKSIWEYDPDATEDHALLLGEIIKRMGI